MTQGRVLIGIIFASALIVICSCSNYEQRDKQAALSDKESIKYLDAKVEERFQSLTPDEHLREASIVIKAGQLELARRHINALPPGHPGKASKERELAAKERMLAAAKEKDQKEDAGPCPDRTVMTIALRSVLARAAHDPASLEDPEVGTPIKVSIQTKAGKVYCWKVPFSFRARNGFGAMRSTNGLIWMKDGASIKTMLEQ